ncbi:MAG: hypothetical protein ACREQ7_08145, partial [Candidatus Binatia bacterium]
AAKALITDRLLNGLPLVAGTSVEEVKTKIKPYVEAGATRIIIPYVPFSEDVTGELRDFISAWDVHRL